jgi:hypothetical protein
VKVIESKGNGDLGDRVGVEKRGAFSGEESGKESGMHGEVGEGGTVAIFLFWARARVRTKRVNKHIKKARGDVLVRE